MDKSKSKTNMPTSVTASTNQLVIHPSNNNMSSLHSTSNLHSQSKDLRPKSTTRSTLQKKYQPPVSSQNQNQQLQQQQSQHDMKASHVSTTPAKTVSNYQKPTQSRINAQSIQAKTAAAQKIARSPREESYQSMKQQTFAHGSPKQPDSLQKTGRV